MCLSVHGRAALYGRVPPPIRLAATHCLSASLQSVDSTGVRADKLSCPTQRPGSSFEALSDDDPVFATDDFRMFAMKVGAAPHASDHGSMRRFLSAPSLL